jgi:hypothetical protein
MIPWANKENYTITRTRTHAPGIKKNLRHQNSRKRSAQRKRMRGRMLSEKWEPYGIGDTYEG